LGKANGYNRRMKNIVILISGRGSNMEAIVRTAHAQKWPAKIAAVISNRADAAGLAFAEANGIATAVVPSRHYSDRDAFDAALMAEIDKHAPDVVALAGFMRILTEPFVRHYAGRMVNVHPSLLPSFRGLHTHRQAIEAGVRAHGASVHFVTPELDGGPIVAQAVVPVLPDDDEDTLAGRVLGYEHVLYPRVLHWMAEGKVALENGRVRVDPGIAGRLTLFGDVA